MKASAKPSQKPVHASQGLTQAEALKLVEVALRPANLQDANPNLTGDDAATVENLAATELEWSSPKTLMALEKPL